MKRERVVSGLLLAVGLAFIFLGQYYFSYRREFYRDGIFLYSAAVVAFGLLWRRVSRAKPGRFRPHARIRTDWRSPRMMAAVGGMALSALVGWLARHWPGTADFSALFWMWLIGVCGFLLAFVRTLAIKDMWPRMVDWVRGRRFELAGLATLVLVALIVRVVGLEHIPANLGGDEGSQAIAALELLEPPLGNPFSTGWYSVPTMSFLAWGLSMRIFGESVAGLRMLSALLGTLTVLTTFLLARQLWGQRVAWPAAIVLACSHFHIHFSRLGSNQIADGLFATLILWLLARGLRSRREVYFALAGAVLGLSWYGYFGARLIGLVVAVYLAWRMAVEYRSRPASTVNARSGQLLLILLGAALVVVAPLLFHYAAYPDRLLSRSRQVGIIASGWLAREQQLTGRSAVSLVLQQFWKSVSAFNYTLDPTFWYHPDIPLLDFVGGALFVLGLLWTMLYYGQPANGLLLLWFWLALVLGWVMTENPPSSMRLTGIAPALALLVGLGLNWLMMLVRRVFSSTVRLPSWSGAWLEGSPKSEPTEVSGDRADPRQRLWDGVAGALLVAMAILNLSYYFVVYTPARVYGNPTAEVGTELGRYLARQDSDCVVYFYAPPVMYWDFGALRFMARGIEGIDVYPGESPAVDWNRGACFVFLPDRLEDLEIIRTQYPGGVEVPARSDADGRLLYVLYEISR